MRTDLDVEINGVAMSELDPRLYVQNIEEAPEERADTADRPHFGQTPLGLVGRETLTVTVRFMIKECGRAARRAVIDKVNGWAVQGWLSLSWRPDQRLYVICTQFAQAAALKWSEDLELVFTAFNFAYWEGANAVTAFMMGSSGSATLSLQGTRHAYLEFELTNTSSTAIDNVRVTANGYVFEFTGLALASGDTLSVYYDEYHYLRASVNGVGKLSCRTAASADDILLNPSADNVVQFTASSPCEVTVKAREVWT